MGKAAPKEAKQTATTAESIGQEALAPTQSGFLEHYATLQDTARALRDQTEPDLDALIPLVDRALAAYKGCKSRIEAVQSLLDQRLGDIEVQKLDSDDDDDEGDDE